MMAITASLTRGSLYQNKFYHDFYKLKPPPLTIKIMHLKKKLVNPASHQVSAGYVHEILVCFKPYRSICTNPNTITFFITFSSAQA